MKNILGTLFMLALVGGMAQEIKNSTNEKFKNLPYILSRPEGYDQNVNHPTIIFLHGGDRSNTRHHPTKYAAKAGLDFPFIVIAPSCTSGCSWSSVDLAGVLKQAGEKVSIDPKRVYLFGYSMGGAGTWANLKKISHLLAAASPLAPAGGSTNDLCSVKDLPIRVYHGTADYGYDRSQNMVKKLKECGSESAELISLEGEGHGIWPTIFRKQDFYDWFLAQSRD
ncbi:MAG: hypothetical protein ABJG78_21500 [Cyclobacteriaceae bacterium]